jgi:NADPH:quinone reductase
MKAIVCAGSGDERVMQLSEVPSPPLTASEVRISVHATAVNRADLLQRRGLYPPPKGASDILGLECAGIVADTGAAVTKFRSGDRVMALLPGGGYAGEVAVDAGSVMPLPPALSFAEGGAFPETFLTAFLNIFMLGEVVAGDSILVHGGGSGVGTAAIALCREAGIRVDVTAGTDPKCRRCEELGAAKAINYRTTDFSTELEGMAMVLDPVGGDYLERNLQVLRTGGRLVVIATMQGTSAELDLRRLMAKRLHVIGSTLRSRSSAEKGNIVQQFLERFGGALTAGRLRPVLHATFPLDRAAEAHRLMASGEYFGKIGLSIR